MILKSPDNINPTIPSISKGEVEKLFFEQIKRITKLEQDFREHQERTDLHKGVLK